MESNNATYIVLLYFIPLIIFFLWSVYISMIQLLRDYGEFEILDDAKVLEGELKDTTNE